MNRYFPMTKTAQQATWCKTTGGNFIPTQFLVKGDKQDGYTISAVDKDLCGFDLITLKTLYSSKMMIEQLNKIGYSDFDKYCQLGAFAWRSHPMPLQLSGEMKVINVDPKNILSAPY